MTLADLCALILGCAMACSLPTAIGRATFIGNGKKLVGIAYGLYQVPESGRKLAIALVPVILARRWRYGGRGRPAEWLVLGHAASELHWFAILGDTRTVPSVFCGGEVAATVTFLVAYPILFALRRYGRMSFVTIGCVALIAWFWGPCWSLNGWITELGWKLFQPPSGDSLFLVGFLGLVDAPSTIVLDALLIAAVGDVSRSRRSDWTWVGWAGLATALAITTGAFLALAYQSLATHARFAAISTILTRAVISCLVFGLAWGCLRVHRLAWNVRSGIGYDGAHPESPPLEA